MTTTKSVYKKHTKQEQKTNNCIQVASNNQPNYIVFDLIATQDTGSDRDKSNCVEFIGNRSIEFETQKILSLIW
jgi:hypothetical protein